MDLLLNFKNKAYETEYHASIDSYLRKIIKSNLAVGMVVLPFTPYIAYLAFRNSEDGWSAVLIRRTVTNASLYAILILVAMFIYKAWSKLIKHKTITRWIFDIFLIAVAGYYAYQFWDVNKDTSDSTTCYLMGWYQCLLTIALFGPISRWYLKLTAYLVIILRFGIQIHLQNQSEFVLVRLIQMILLEALLTYSNERDARKYFLEKQSLYEESKVFKEIFDMTSDGVIIYGLQDGMSFQNGYSQKCVWWQSERNLQQNLQKIKLKGFKRTEHFASQIELDFSSFDLSSSQCCFWVFLGSLVNQLSRCINSRNSSQRLKPGKLMLLTGVVERDSSDPLAANSNYLVEIKIMFTYFQEKPSLAIILSDITERSLVTVLQENNNYKNRLLASVSHELRTPLNASINFTQAAIEHPDLSNHPEIRDNYLMPALRSNRLLLHLINDILDFSQMSAHKLRLVYENKDVGFTLDECVNLVKMQATRKKLKILTEYKFDGEKREFCTDHNRLAQIMLNLLSNALKFTLEGEIRVSAKLSTDVKTQEIEGEERITIGQTEPDTRLPVTRGRARRILSISVSDTGIGISEENKIKLFKAFEKIELGDRIALNTQGVGLGLVISNNLVLMLGPPEQNNGMKVESTETKGTTFSFWIVEQSCSEEVSESSVKSEDMCSRMEEHPDNVEERLETISNLVPRKTMDTHMLTHNKLLQTTSPVLNLGTINASKFPQILIVDDDIFNISALEMILINFGYSCDTAFNGQQAIQKIMERQSESENPETKTTQYKLVFMDCNMPIMNGFEAMKILKDKMVMGELEEMRIIACTAYLSENEKELVNKLGIDGYCLKPIKKENLQDILIKFLQQP